MKFLIAISAVCAILGLVACGSSDDSSSTTADSASTVANKPEPKDKSNEPEDKATAIRSPQAKPVLVVPKGPPPKGLVIRNLKAGKGTTATAGDKVTVEYTGYNYVNHEEFTNHAHNWDRGEPLVFQLDGGELIPGVEQGVEGMRVGGRRELVIPPDLAYGNVNPPPEVGPDETVIYYVELLGLDQGQ
ncbi:MAG TPA: FKBP-type peptidyl-prolyl cis-trans isomerase [Solirubrobacterales bacterium]|nr:FKBP-type peptidyl-prolyl cis-trans isomerase [Solirubrobacterales bacterium]